MVVCHVFLIFEAEIYYQSDISMKNKFLLLIFCALFHSTYCLAGWNIQSNKTYYLRCDYAQGFVGLSSEQGQVGHVLYQQTAGDTPTPDAYWQIIPSGQGYAFKNALTGQYLSWSDDYKDLRNLDLADELVDDNQRWEIVPRENGLNIRSLSNSTYYFHMRNSHFVALYTNGNDAKSIFHIYDDAGQEIVYADIVTPIESISLQVPNTRVRIGDVVQVQATVLPVDASFPSLSWSSDNTDFPVTQQGVVTVNDYGRATITASAQDGSDVSASITLEAVDAYMAYGEEMLYLRHRDSTVTVLPLDLVESYSYRGSLFTATLVNQETLQLVGVVDTCSAAPADLPAFYSYKFNNKYNPQVFTDVLAATPRAEEISLSVAGIGKWLTASFQLADPATQVYVGTVRQRSKYTRQSFASPVTYRFTNPKWSIVRLRQNDDGSAYVQEISPYERKQIVRVTFLTDYSTNEYTVPRIDITLTDNPGEWSSANWIGMNGKSTYENATITIQGGGVFPDMPSTPMYIKGRGNSSWSGSWSSKNPYHFKFDVKQKPLGMTAGKHWILLANKQSGSMTTNAMGMKGANIFESAGNNHIVPVELYINGSYRGSYNLTERVGFSNNSIDLPDESCAAMLELDTYGDETIYLSNAYGISTKIHTPDQEDIDEGKSTLSFDQIIADYDNMTNVLAQGGDEYTKLVDAEYLARYLSACELMWNFELQHPKSVFLYSENVTDEPAADGFDATPWVFGPLWDSDWAFGYDGSGVYYINNIEEDFFDALQGRCNGFWYDLRHNSEEVDRIYYQLWHDLKQRNVVQELYDYAQEYYDFAKKSFEHNRQNETDNRDGRDYAEVTRNSQDWFTRRFEYIFNSLTAYDLPEQPDDPNVPECDVMGDVNGDGVISAADVVTLLNALTGLPTETYYSARADIDSNGDISIGDVVMLCNMVMEQVVSVRHQLHLPAATMNVYATAATLLPHDEGVAHLIVEVAEGQYSALQMDICLPQGVELEGVEIPASLSGMTVRTHLLDNGNYRLLLYADGSVTLPDAPVTLGLRLLSGDALQGRLHISAAKVSTSLGEEERMKAHSATLNVLEETTGLQQLPSADNADGGFYDLGGRRVKQPTKGVYIHNNKKYIR